MAGTDHLTELEVWTDFECAGGSKVTDFGIASGAHPLFALRHREILEEHKDTLDGEYQLSAAVHSNVTYGRVVRAVYDTAPFREWRLKSRNVNRIDGGGEVGTFTAEGPHKDLVLRSGVVTMPLANGGKAHRVKLIMTPSEWLAYILRNSDAPSWVNVGTVDFTERIYVALDGHNPWRAAVEVAQTASERENAPAYLRLVRSGTTAYDLDLVLDPAPAADTLNVTFTQNELTLIEREVEDKFATRVFMKSAEHDGVQMTLSENGFEVSTVVSNTLTMLDEILSEDDQLNGLYIEKPDLTTTQITDSTAPSTIVVASATGIAAGDIVRVVADSAGSDLIYLGSPIGQAAHGVITRTIDRPDILPVKHLGPDGFLLNGTTVPTGWQKVGNPTVTVDTTDQFSQFGLKSWHVVAADGEGLELASALSVRFSDRVFRYQYVTYGVAIWIVSGTVLIEFDDETDPANVETFFDPETSRTPARTNETGRWVPLYVFPGINFFQQSQPRLFRPRIYAEGSADFYWDAWILAHAENPTAIPDFREGSGANDLWFVARDYLRAFGQAPPKYYETRFVDRNRTGLVTGEEVTLGGDVTMTDANLGVSTTKRIVEADRDLLVPGRTEVVPERVPAHLADRFLGRKRPPIIKETPANVQPPDCDLNLTATLIGDLVLSWDAGNWHTVRVVDVTNIPGVGKARMQGGSTLYIGRATEFVVPYDPSGASGLPDPSLISDVMIETYNAWGKPGECYEVTAVKKFQIPGTCQNLITDSSAPQPFCSANQTGPDLLLRSPPLTVQLSQLGNLVTPGVTRITICHEAASGKAGGASFSGFVAHSGSQNASTQRFRLERMDAGTISNPYGHSMNIAGNHATPKWSGVQVLDNGSDHTTRLHYGEATTSTSTLPDVQSSGICCLETTSNFYGERFVPGLFVRNYFGLETGPAEILYSHAYRRPYVECENMTGQRMRLERATGFRYLGAAGFQNSTLQSGTGVLNMNSASDTAGARWSKFILRDGSNNNLATFLGSEHPSGVVWPGDRYTYDAGGSLVAGVGGVLAVNAAGTLGLLESGLMYVRDWESAGNSTLDPTEWIIGGSPMIVNPGTSSQYLEMTPGDSIVRSDVGDEPECVHEVVFRRAASTAGGVFPGVFFGQPDIYGNLRATFDDGTIVSSPGGGDGVDATNFQQDSLTVVWPAAATSVTIEQLHQGTSVGTVCSRNVSMVVGGVCCATTSPIPSPGLPPTTIDCLLSATSKVSAVGDCAAGTGVQVAVSVRLAKGSTCPNLDVPGAFRLDAWYFEEHSPISVPGDFILVRQVQDVAPIPTTDPALLTPSGAFVGWAANITTDDPLGLNPNPGTARASDGSGGEVGARQWYVRVILVDQFGNGSAVIDTTENSSGTAYGWCP